VSLAKIIREAYYQRDVEAIERAVEQIDKRIVKANLQTCMRVIGNEDKVVMLRFDSAVDDADMRALETALSQAPRSR